MYTKNRAPKNIKIYTFILSLLNACIIFTADHTTSSLQQRSVTQKKVLIWKKPSAPKEYWDSHVMSIVKLAQNPNNQQLIITLAKLCPQSCRCPSGEANYMAHVNLQNIPERTTVQLVNTKEQPAEYTESKFPLSFTSTDGRFTITTVQQKSPFHDIYIQDHQETVAVKK